MKLHELQDGEVRRAVLSIFESGKRRAWDHLEGFIASQPLRDVLAAAYTMGCLDTAEAAGKVAAEREPMMPEGL